MWFIVKVDRETFKDLFSNIKVSIWMNLSFILHKKWSFPLRISSVNVTESAVFTFTEEILNGKLHFLQYQLSTTKHNYTFFYQLQNQVHAFAKTQCSAVLIKNCSHGYIICWKKVQSARRRLYSIPISLLIFIASKLLELMKNRLVIFVTLPKATCILPGLNYFCFSTLKLTTASPRIKPQFPADLVTFT